MTNLPPPKATLSTQQRHAYLHAMGVSIWVDRASTPIITTDTATSKTTTQASLPSANQQPQLIDNTRIAEAQSVIKELSATLSSTPKTTTKPTTPAPITSPREPVNCADATWEALTSQIKNCQSCDLHASRSQAVVGSGDKSATCLIIGDAPTAEDDRKGHPFVGKSGQLLTNMLLAIDLPRNSVYLTQATKCRATNDRLPSENELKQCSNYLHRQIELIKPDKILVLGRAAAQSLLQKKAPLSLLRGKVHTLPNTEIAFVVTYHPRILLKKPKDKRNAWEDLKLFKSIHT